MKVERLRSTFTGQERYPCELVLCNLADTKRRNSHLGSVAVDADIAAFDAIVGTLTILERGDRSRRVGGDEWLFLGADGRAFAGAALAAYARTDTYRAGWRCRATKDGDEKDVVEVVSTSITRTMRIAITTMPTLEDLEPLAARLADAIWRAPVGTPSRLEDLTTEPTSRWQCVAAYPARTYSCPFCTATAFEWLDGDDAVYSGDATCKTCHAALSFSDAGAVLDPSPDR